MLLYKTNQELPADVRRSLSDDAQELYRAAFNCALHWYGEESKAHQVAWSAVKNQVASLNSSINGGSNSLLA